MRNPFRDAMVLGIEIELPSGAVRRYEDRYDLSPTADGRWELAAHAFTWHREVAGAVVVRDTVQTWGHPGGVEVFHVDLLDTEPDDVEVEDVAVFWSQDHVRLETYMLWDATDPDPVYQGRDPQEVERIAV